MRNPIAYHPSTFQRQEPSGAPRPAGRWSPAWLTFRWELAFYIALALVALAMRVWELGDRAMHHDESLHALYSWYITEGRGYEHNPLLHGPLQYHVNALVFFLFGDNDATARIAYALVGTGLVALPWLLRDWLGRTGAMCAAVLLALSPTMLYFSRFARNDILMAALTLGLVIVVWRYMRDRQPVYLYLAAAILALAFSAKETIYITLFAMGAFLAFLSIGDLKGVVLGRLRISEISAPAAMLLVLFTLSLPMAAAASSVVQGPLGIVLLNDDPGAGRVGMPLEGGNYVAAALTAVLFAVSAALGIAWDWRRWLLCAGIFGLIYVLLFTSFFTSPFGAVTGVWQSLGYWLAQQDVGRGSQPWYYYFVIGSNYEFLAAAAAIGGAVWAFVRGGVLAPLDAVWNTPLREHNRDAFASPQLFAVFLIFWGVVNFILFTLAAEKMPWLLVHVMLPAALLAGLALGRLVALMPWRRAVRENAWLALPLTPLALLLAYRVLFYESPAVIDLQAFLRIWGILLLLFGAIAGVLYFAMRLGTRQGLGLAGLALAVVLLALGVRAGWTASYHNGDTPTEMLVYTMSSPDIVNVLRDVKRLSEQSGRGEAIPISIDGHSGFAWPWAWYFRDYEAVGYPTYASPRQPENPNGGVVLVHVNNEALADAGLREAGFTQVLRYKHRWWFPESYRNLTPGGVLNGIADRSAWQSAFRYWLFRDFETPLGSEDAYLYYSDDLLQLGAIDPG
ncbi:MAG: TIGR03663 family protein [Chloroflexi bacterium]|nr:TIGR03663 family protein [Chloroflexota bacterium]